MILSVGALFLGIILGHITGLFDLFLDKTIPGVHEAAAKHGTDWFVVGISATVFLAGFALAYGMYGAPSQLPQKVSAVFGPLVELSRRKFYLDEVYDAIFVWPLRGLAELSRLVDWFVIDVVFVGGISKIPALMGRLPRPIQNGLVQFYALAMMLAMAVLLWALVSRQG
jgi:NADH-quinone oxidoreductase subunit L